MNIRQLLFLLIPFVLGFTINQPIQTLSGHWKLVCFTDLATGQQDCRPIKDSIYGNLKFEFQDDGKAGIINGRTTTNSVQGVYKIFEKGKLKVESFGGTKINEVGWGRNFWKTIYQSSSFNYNVHKDTLNILYDNDTKIMKFVKY